MQSSDCQEPANGVSGLTFQPIKGQLWDFFFNFSFKFFFFIFNFLFNYSFELQMLYLILDLLNSISFNHETFWRKQKQNLKVTWTVVESQHWLDGLRTNQIVYSREPFGNQPWIRNKRIINSGKWTEFGLLSFLYTNHTLGPQQLFRWCNPQDTEW